MFIVLHLSFDLTAQAQNDFIWILGYPPNSPEDSFGGIKLDFHLNDVIPEYFNTICPASQPAIICSNAGHLLAYSDGCSIYNANHEWLEGGDSIAYGGIWQGHCQLGYPGTQNKLFLTWPGDSTKSILLYLKSDDNITNYSLLYSVIGFETHFSEGHILAKDNFLINAGLTALITAVKHANGRDWWVILPEHHTNRFFVFLLSPEGISLNSTQAIGDPWGERAWGSQAIFTPDGTKYVRYNPWKGLDILDFDRCSGILSNVRQSGVFPETVFVAGGVACSADSKYLYVSDVLSLYQFDLTTNDIFSSKLLIDTFDYFLDPLPNYFYHMSLAPDNRIYIFGNNSVRHLSVINHPERSGKACQFVQHQFALPAFTLPGGLNLPYFRLGPSDNTSCDTLGINNSPISYFRYKIDPVRPLDVEFINQSYFLPQVYSWSFGNETSSFLKDPTIISYENQGVYEVCLTVSNTYGTNTFCRNVELKDTITGINNPISLSTVDIYPNPFQNQITVTFSDQLSSVQFNLYTCLGTLVYSNEIFSYHPRIEVSDLPNGLYYFTLFNERAQFHSGVIVKSD